MSFQNPSPVQGHFTEMINGLNFYKEELIRLKLRLLEVAGKNSGLEARQGMDHFEAQFTVHQNRLDELRHKVHQLHQKMAEDAMTHAGKVESELIQADKDTLDEYRMEEKMMHELREEFNRYLSKWM